MHCDVELCSSVSLTALNPMDSYHPWLWALVGYAAPWAVCLQLGDDKLFIRPKHNIYTFFMIVFGLFYSKLLFVFQICHVNCETNRKLKKTKFIFKKMLLAQHLNI